MSAEQAVRVFEEGVEQKRLDRAKVVADRYAKFLDELAASRQTASGD
jgi:hypothetical protein